MRPQASMGQYVIKRKKDKACISNANSTFILYLSVYIRNEFDHLLRPRRASSPKTQESIKTKIKILPNPQMSAYFWNAVPIVNIVVILKYDPLAIIIGSRNGFAPAGRQAISRSNADLRSLFLVNLRHLWVSHKLIPGVFYINALHI